MVLCRYPVSAFISAATIMGVRVAMLLRAARGLRSLHVLIELLMGWLIDRLSESKKAVFSHCTC